MSIPNTQSSVTPVFDVKTGLRWCDADRQSDSRSQGLDIGNGRLPRAIDYVELRVFKKFS